MHERPKSIGFISRSLLVAWFCMRKVANLALFLKALKFCIHLHSTSMSLFPYNLNQRAKPTMTFNSRDLRVIKREII